MSLPAKQPEDIQLEMVPNQEKEEISPISQETREETLHVVAIPEGGYRLYRQRFVGLTALVSHPSSR